MRKTIFVLFLLGLFLISTPSVTSLSDHQALETTKVKNVILMIGDGMGFQHIRSASYVEYGVPDGLFMQMEEFLNLSITTNSLSHERTDSAASATAFATGSKTLNGRLSVDPNGNPITPTILEYAESLNKSTGLVSTTRYNHATPAAFAVHYESRNEYEAIAQSMLTKNIEIIFGGGEITIPSLDFINQNNYTYLSTKQELSSSTAPNLLGVFGQEHLTLEADLDFDTDVRLSDMTSKALEILSKDPDGFFLMIESGQIDLTAHNRDLQRNVMETIQFDYSIKMAYDFVQENPNTLLIVAADHETGGLVFNHANDLDDNLPDPNSSDEDRRTRRSERIEQLDAYIPTTGHTAVPVPFLLTGASEEYIDSSCTYNNAHVFGVMKNAFDGTVLDSCPADIPGYDDPEVDDQPEGFATHLQDDTTTTSSKDGSRLNFNLFGILAIPALYLTKKKSIR